MEKVRKGLYYFGWAVLIALPIIFAVQVFMMQDLPRIEMWQWAVPFAAVVLIYFTRNRDEVLHHHVV